MEMILNSPDHVRKRSRHYMLDGLGQSPVSVLRCKCGTVSESDEKWGGQSWLPPGFYPAFSGVLHTLKSRLERRLQARLPAPLVLS
jgi:hypothetical protein